MDITTKLYFGDNLHQIDKVARDYVVNSIMEVTDEESAFGRITKSLRQKGREAIEGALPKLYLLGYEVMLTIGKKENESLIIGHMAFQEHLSREKKDPEWKMFSCYLIPEYRGRGHAYQLAEQLVKQARKKGIKKMKIGSGNYEKMDLINRHIRNKQAQLGLSFNSDTQWAEIL